MCRQSSSSFLKIIPSREPNEFLYVRLLPYIWTNDGESLPFLSLKHAVIVSPRERHRRFQFNELSFATTCKSIRAPAEKSSWWAAIKHGFPNRPSKAKFSTP